MKRIVCVSGISVGIILCVAAVAFAKDDAKIIRQANRLYREQKYDDALKLYEKALEKDPDSALVNFNAADALYKKGDYQEAAANFQKVALSAKKHLEAKADYNLGNTKYKLGKVKEGADIQSAIELLKEALFHYERAIKNNPKDADAKFNHKLVEEELKKLEEKVKQQKAEEQKQQQEQQQEGQEQPQQVPEQLQEQAQPEAKEEEKHEEQKAQEQKTEEQKAEGKEEQAKEMSKEEAQVFLEGYREEPLGAPQEEARKARASGAIKDW